MPVPVLAGKPKRTLFRRPLGIMLILLQKALWGIALVALATGLFLIYGLHITRPVQLLFQDELAEDPHDLLAHLLIGLLPGLAHRTALLLGIGAVVYAALEAVEVWGLWREILWVELLIIAETAALLPYEGWELSHRVTPFKLTSVVINLLILAYLVARYLQKRAARHSQEVCPQGLAPASESLRTKR